MTTTTRTADLAVDNRGTFHSVWCYECGSTLEYTGDTRPTACPVCDNPDVRVQTFATDKERQDALVAMADLSDFDLRLVAQGVRNACYPMVGNWPSFTYEVVSDRCPCCGEERDLLRVHLAGVNEPGEFQTYCRCGATWNEDPRWAPSMDGYEVLDDGTVAYQSEVL